MFRIYINIETFLARLKRVIVQGGYRLLKKKVRTFQELFKNISRIFQEHNFKKIIAFQMII